MIINEQKPIEFINKCECMVDPLELEKAILWYSKAPVARLKKIFMHGNYPAVAIHKEKIHVHRLLVMYFEKRLLDSTEYVHHKDSNKMNALKQNLAILPRSFHQSLHNKGKKLSEKHKRLLSEANRNRAGKVKYKKRRDIPLDELEKLLKEGKSINHIARYFKVDWSTIKSRMNENPELIKEA